MSITVGMAIYIRSINSIEGYTYTHKITIIDGAPLRLILGYHLTGMIPPYSSAPSHLRAPPSH